MSPGSAVTPMVSYARISADLRRDEHGVQDQHKLNRATAERHGWTVVHEFTDNDKSAAKASVIRDEFEDMLRVLRAGKLADGAPVRGALVVADDRLARRPGDYERFVEAITYQDGRESHGHQRTWLDHTQQLTAMIRKRKRSSEFPDTEEITRPTCRATSVPEQARSSGPLRVLTDR